MVNLNPVRVRRISPSLVEERSADGQLVILTVGDGSHQTVDLWAGAARSAISQWPYDRTCLLLHDLRKCGALAYDVNMQGKFLDLHNFKPGINRHTALVMPDGFTAELTRLFVKVQELSLSTLYPIRWEIFLSRKNALNWLQNLPEAYIDKRPAPRIMRRI